jgi:hypothetical protein
MNLSLRLFFVTFLVLLQFIAPLVHAHTSEKVLSQGFHIPGLEVYARSVDATLSTHALLCKTNALCGDIDGHVVGVDTGVHREMAIAMQRLSKIIADLDHGFCLSQAPAVFQTAFSAFFSTLTIQAVFLPAKLSDVAHSPRAPPLQA